MKFTRRGFIQGLVGGIAVLLTRQARNADSSVDQTVTPAENGDEPLDFNNFVSDWWLDDDLWALENIPLEDTTDAWRYSLGTGEAIKDDAPTDEIYVLPDYCVWLEDLNTEHHQELESMFEDALRQTDAAKNQLTKLGIVLFDSEKNI